MVIARAATLPAVERSLIRVKKAVPLTFIINKMSMSTKNPIVTFTRFLESIPSIERAFFTTPVAITPQAILADTYLVTPMNIPVLAPNAAFA